MDQADTTELKVNWGPVAAMLFGIGSFFFGQFVGFFIYLGLYAMSTGRDLAAALESLSDASALQQFFSVLAIEAVTLGLLYWFLRRRKATFKTLGLRHFEGWDILRALSGFAVYIVLYYLAVLIFKAAIPTLDLEQDQELGFDTAVTGIGLVPVFISLVVLPPLVEEILCRGFIYTGLRTKLKPILATLITSALFAIAHLQWGSAAPLLWVAAIDTFVLSLVLCYLRESTGRLWASIILHAIKNGIAFLVLFVFKVS